MDRYSHKKQKTGEMCTTNYSVTVIPGGGIGPEIVREVKKVLDQAGKVFSHLSDYIEIPVGGCSIDAYGVPLTEETLETARKSNAVPLGVVDGDVGNSRWYDVAPNLRPEAGLLAIHRGLGLFADTRPAYLYRELAETRPLKKEIIGNGLDMAAMRESTGGPYLGDGYTRKVDGVMTVAGILTYNEKEIRRITVKAFDIAMKRRKKVTSVDRTNVLDSSRLWGKVVEEVAVDYPGVELSHMLMDNYTMQPVTNPGQFDVILTGDTLGGIPSDEASMTTGSIGILSSASMNESKFSLYKLSHGSMPDTTEKNMANPTVTTLPATMLLRYSFDMDRGADTVEKVVRTVLTEGYRTGDAISEGCTKASTCKMGDLIAERIG